MSQKITILDVIDLFISYYQRPGNSAWGSLHVVLDDNNVGESFVRGCIDYATERSDVEGIKLAKILLSMSRTQRLRLPHMVYKRLREVYDR